MGERITLRFLLYLVLVVCVARSASPHLSDSDNVVGGIGAIIALGALAISAYDPRYSPWIEPPPKRPRED